MAFTFKPKLGSYSPSFRKLCVTMQASGSRQSVTRQHAIDTARLELLPFDRLGLSTSELRFSVCVSVVLDLLEQGWDLRVDKKGIELSAPNARDENPGDNKIRVRRSHLISRTAHIHRPAVRKFIETMESPRLTRAGWHSIYSLMRDGQKLADRLRAVRSVREPSKLAKRLTDLIDPYLQIVDADNRCAFTGLPLADIWRYFRYTWINPPQSVPGRSMRFLIRDRAAPNHPIIGLAALGSSTAQQTVRDQWIGWEGPRLTQWLASKSDRTLQTWVTATLKRLIQAIYVEDFVKKRLIRRAEIARPTDDTILRLRSAATKALQRHRLHPHLATHKNAAGSKIRGRWRQEATTSLFTAKRAKTLALLLNIRRSLAESVTPPRQPRVSIGILRKAASQLARSVKSEHVGLNMMDITTCGAIAPYNHLLGGKLVCLLLAGSDVRNSYVRRYGNRPSIIASSMRGAAMRRSSDLVLLMTTSLFGRSSSQYNRIRVRVSDIHGKQSPYSVEYLPLGRSIGFGSHHFSRLTTGLMEQLIGRASDGRKVNSIFGEGVNPLMRKIRDALLILGLPGDLLLHGDPRIVYAVPLAQNFREILFGEQTKPRYYVSRSIRTADLASYWRRRWLANRIHNDDVLDRVSKETLCYPLTHGGCVSRDVAPDQRDLFTLATEPPLARAG
jgi:hypothetical protein